MVFTALVAAGLLLGAWFLIRRKRKPNVAISKQQVQVSTPDTPTTAAPIVPPPSVGTSRNFEDEHRATQPQRIGNRLGWVLKVVAAFILFRLPAEALDTAIAVATKFIAAAKASRFLIVKLFDLSIGYLVGLFGKTDRRKFELHELERLPRVNEPECRKPYLRTRPHIRDTIPSFAV
jgi:hypothetical protein